MIGDKIKLLREARGLTQQQISQDPDFGIKQGTLSAYERNAREPNVETIRKIAEYFGVTADYLIGISEHKTAEHDAVGQIIPLSDAAIDSLLAELLPMADHINRSASADRVALEMLTSYKRKLLDRALDELCEELTGASGLSTSTKPTKGGERHGNSSKTRR